MHPDEDHSLGKDNYCVSCHIPVSQAKSWGWMTPDEQSEHLVKAHGYDRDWLNQEHDLDLDPGRDPATRWWRDQTQTLRDCTHDEDHEEYEHGGGDTLHNHDLVDKREIELAIESIKRTVNK